ncbi:MAG: carbohydrate-binding domain-containing protein [Bacteroidaceae bacterium]|nr:carbohydrate-binding domain-containing protein [Bacteroidaceae bacterium]
MKKILATIALAVFATAANAQWIRVWSGGESTRYALTEASSLPYTAAGSCLEIGGFTYSTAEIDSITIVNPVTVTWDGDHASVDIPYTAEGVTATVDGGHVTITNTCTTIEHEFILAGSSAHGSLTYVGEYKCKFHLNGLNLTSDAGGAIDIQCGKRIDLILEDGTTNVVADAATGDQKAAFNCQGHLEVAGSGSLTVTGNCRHALRSNEYLQLKKSVGALTVSSAVGDGIHCGEYFLMNGGTVTIANVGGDGLQVETDAASEEALNGQFVMNGGTLDVTVTSTDTKGIRLDASAEDASIVPEMSLLGGVVTVNLNSTALGAKAIASEGNLTIGSPSSAPTVAITVAADIYTDPDSGEENRATGLKADQTLTIAGGETTVNAIGPKSRGVRATTLIATGGSLIVTNTGSKSQGIKLDNTFVSGQGGIVSGSFKY